MSLDELYTMSDLVKIKQAIVELVGNKDCKTLNRLLRRTPFVSKLDSRKLNEDIPPEDMRFTKRD